MKRILDSLKIIWDTRKKDLIIMIISFIFKLAFSISLVYATGILFFEVKKLISGESLDFRKILIFGFILFMNRFSYIFYDRFFSTFVSMPKVEYNMKQNLHRKVSKISSKDCADVKTNMFVNQAIFAGANIFRLVQIVVQLFFTFLSSLSIFTLITFMNWYLGIGLLFAILPQILLEYMDIKIQLKTKDKKIEYKRIFELYRKTLTGDPQFLETRVVGAYDFFLKKYNQVREERDKLLNFENHYLFKLSLFLLPLLLFSEISGILIGSILLLNNLISFSVFGSALSAYNQLKTDIKNIISLIQNMKKFEVMIEPYFQFMKKDERIGTEVTDNLTISFKNVYFKYPNANDFSLSGINLEINKGEKVAIVGENGSGKTTLSKLILGEYTATTGDVRFGKMSTKDLKEPEIYNSISQVNQLFNKYSLSLKDNISFGKFLKFENDYICDFLKKSISMDAELTKTFGGMEFSGGEWQRVAILRGFNKNFELITLDEPTSAIDPINEKEIYDFFDNHIKDETGVIVTHRLGAIKYVQRIIVLDNGRIIEDGSFDELINKKGKFYEIYSSQKNMFLI